MIRVVGGSLFVALLALAIACGGAKRASTAPAGSVMGGAEAPPPRSSDHHAEIERLESQIRNDFSSMGMPAPATMGVSPSCTDCSPETMSKQITLPTSDASCKPGLSDTCRDSCRLADSICRNAGRICEIAAQMDNDTWANGKCVDGKGSCDKAKERCCSCQL